MDSLASSITRCSFSSIRRSLFVATIASTALQSHTQAQSIIPATDGTGTAVIQQGDDYIIEAGSLSDDGTNLFHSFSAFSLSPSETANFLAQPDVQNILASVSGGAPSILNGLLQVNSTEATPNFFLMNPAGVLFGANAQISLPGNLTVTTADAIAFNQKANQQAWFNAAGANAYASLTGSPTGEFAFLDAQLGSLANEGNLSLSEGSSLTFLGGSIVNTGTLSAPGGTVTIAAIPNSSGNSAVNSAGNSAGIVRLSQVDSLLSLEVSAEGLRSLTNPVIPSLSLAQLLTYSEQSATAQGYADTLILNADGSVTLSGTVSTQTIAHSPGTGGDITVVGEHINVTNAQILASGQAGGGHIRIGGNYRGGEGLPTAQKTAVDQGSVLEASAIAQGNGGNVTIWADGTTQYAGQINASGGQAGGNGGLVEVSGKETLLFRGNVDTHAPNGTLGSLLLDPEDITITAGSGLNDDELSDSSIFVGDGIPGELFTISESVLEGLAGSANVTLEASNNIFIETLNDDVLSFVPGTGNVTFKADADGDARGDISIGGSNYQIVAPGRSLELSGNNITLGVISSAGLPQGGDITLQATGSITVDALNTSSPNASGAVFVGADGDISVQSIVTDGGDVAVESLFGAINIFDIVTSRGLGDGGNVDLIAAADITVFSIDTVAGGLSGDVTAESIDGNIEIDSLDVGIGPNSGFIALLAPLGDVFVNGDFFPPGPFPPMEGEGPGNPFEGLDEEDFFFDDEFFDEDGDFFEDRSSLEDLASEDDLLALDDFGELEEELAELDELESGLEEELAELDEELDEIEQELDELEDELSEDSDEFGDGAGEFGALSEWDVAVLDAFEASEELSSIEQNSKEDFSNYFGRSLGGEEPTPAEVRQLLEDVQAETGNRSAVVYVKTPLLPQEKQAPEKQTPEKQAPEALKESPEDSLELLIFTADQAPIKINISAVDTQRLIQTIQQFRSTLSLSARRNNNSYLAPSQQLHTTLIAPIEEALAEKNIDTLVFSMSAGLRSLPVAALHDGEQFLVEKYSLSVVPSLSLIDTRQSSLGEAQVLAMGVSEFDTLAPLPAVPVEVDIINQLWPGTALLNENSTRNNLISQRQQSPYQVIHLATHADFKPGRLENSYIQLWDEQIRLSELHRLGWEYPAVDLLVLSACSTAVGSPEAEMGFAGLAIASGVRSAMASLWPVSDVGTLGLMSEFYGQLKTRTVKVEALRSAQLAMLQGTIQRKDGELLTSHASFPLPTESGRFSNVDLSHPYYWAGFTMIGSPW
ncbi:MAG: CHAT domain-containing protein [Cyanobacteria bacterium P01_D01_bin.105]